MKILSIDTSSKNCSVSIVDASENNFEIIALKNNDDEKTHSQKLMPLISEMFSEVNLTLDDINLLACSVGPGSFTGIRIGVSTVKAFADVKNIPIASCTSLESLAYNVEESGYIIPILDAKNNNVYSTIFHNREHIFENIADDINTCLDKYVSFLPTTDSIFFVGDGSIIYKDLILEKFANYNVNFSLDNIQSSLSLAKCAYNKYRLGMVGDSNSLTPIYLRKSQAERNLDGKQ